LDDNFHVEKNRVFSFEVWWRVALAGVIVGLVV